MAPPTDFNLNSKRDDDASVSLSLLQRMRMSRITAETSHHSVKKKRFDKKKPVRPLSPIYNIQPLSIA